MVLYPRFPTHWFGQRVQENSLLRSFRLIILGHGILGLAYFLCAHPFASLENVSRVMLGSGVLTSLLVMQGMMRLLSPKVGWPEQLARALLVGLGLLVCLFPSWFINGWPTTLLRATFWIRVAPKRRPIPFLPPC